jgi:hypothetical protein
MLGYRVVHQEALGAEMTVAELHDANAREEVAALVSEVRRVLR